MQPALEMPGRHRQHQRVDGPVLQLLLDRVHRVMARGHEPVHVRPGRLAYRRQGLAQDLLGGHRLGPALRVCRMPLGRCRVGHEQADLERPVSRVPADLPDQIRGGVDAVGDNQNASGYWRHGRQDGRARLTGS